MIGDLFVWAMIVGILVGAVVVDLCARLQHREDERSE